MKIKIKKIAQVILIGCLFAYISSDTARGDLKLNSDIQNSQNRLAHGNGTDVSFFLFQVKIHQAWQMMACTKH
jgi:hypothetical protein